MHNAMQKQKVVVPMNFVVPQAHYVNKKLM